MRITAEPNCPDHWGHTFRGGDEFDIQITLDGVTVPCITVTEADDVAGYVIQFVYLRDSMKPFDKVRREGAVTITGTKQPWLTHA